MEADSWEDRRSAEIYAEVVRRGNVYRDLATRLVELARPCPGGVVVDLATGTGIVLEKVLARVGAASALIGLDRSEAMLHVARRMIPLEEVIWLRADPAQVPLGDSSVSLIFSSAAFWHFPQRRRVMIEIARLLQPGGRLAFNLPLVQLVDEADEHIPPIQLALAREGERRFGRSPDAGGPMVVCSELREDIAGAGMTIDEDATITVCGTQRELLDLLDVAAIGARFYPEVRRTERRAWVSAVAERVDLDEVVLLRWRHFLVSRPATAAGG